MKRKPRRDVIVRRFLAGESIEHDGDRARLAELLEATHGRPVR